MHPKCKFCNQNGIFAVAQSTDNGKTINWIFVCPSHIVGWHDEVENGDWDAPVYELVPVYGHFTTTKPA